MMNEEKQTGASAHSALSIQHSAFHPVIHLPPVYDVYDFTDGYDPDRPRRDYGIGRYDEVRPGMYTTEQFEAEHGRVRNIHMGIDIGCPAGTPVHAFDAGTLILQRDNDQPGDYGPTIICEHVLDGQPIYVLLGHLARSSLQSRQIGTDFKRGDVLGHVGEKHENGGWNPHVHVQLAIDRPDVADLPGAVSADDRAEARRKFPDPLRILGPIY
ncbi:MAG: peptidoglycan DD-metalloendopeptidase family protein [Planctomycetota bacterium]